MKLLRGDAVTPDSISSGFICRKSRLGSVISTFVFGAVFAAPAILFWWRGSSWLLIGGAGLVALAIFLFMLDDARACFRPTNWVLWISGDQVWINLKSYQDENPLDTLSVVELSTREIAEARRRTERYTTPSSKGGNVKHRLDSLELVLDQADEGPLGEALTAIRAARQPWKSVLGMRWTHQVTMHSVTLPDAKVIRIAWSGGQGHGIAPRLARALERLQEWVRVGDALETDAGDWTNLAEARIDDEVLDLVSKGHTIAAVRLLSLRRGMSTTDAKKFVDELKTRT
jgi:hypothetical protein